MSNTDAFRLSNRKPVYKQLWESCKIRAKWSDRVEEAYARISATQEREICLQIERTTTVPWWFVGILWYRESNLSHERHLHNGDPLTGKTIQMPKNRPLHSPQNGKRYTFLESAIDALRWKGYDLAKDRSIEAWLWRLELWNGFGYALHGMNSEYLWNGSNHFGDPPHRGKFVADDEFDPNAESDQVGAATLMYWMHVRGEIPDLNPNLSAHSSAPTPTPLIVLGNVFKYYKNLPHQDNALNWLQENISQQVLEDFYRKLGYETSLKDLADSYQGTLAEQEAIALLQLNATAEILEQFSRQWRTTPAPEPEPILLVMPPKTLMVVGPEEVTDSLEKVISGNLRIAPELLATSKKLATEVQSYLIKQGLLEPPADGNFGPLSLRALLDFQEACVSGSEADLGFLGSVTAQKLKDANAGQSPLILKQDLASRIVRYMVEQNYYLAQGIQLYNIVYLEGADPDGTPNSNKPNCFNDRRLIIQVLQCVPAIIGNWEATTEPGSHYTYNPMNPKGAARIKFGQYKAWRIGTHGTAEPHEALLQAAPITVHRDANKDFKRTGDNLDTGLFGVNQHYGFDYPQNNIRYASAGCLVGRARKGHREFMAILKRDKRYQLNRSYLFYTTIIDARELK
jgi:lysozyme family protein